MKKPLTEEQIKRRNEYMKAYHQRDYAKKRKKELSQRKEAKEKEKEYNNKPESVKRMKEYSLLKKYGLSLEQYKILLEKTNGYCYICEKEFNYDNYLSDQSPVVDHDHETGEVRGIICRRCNIKIGQFNDDYEMLLRAVKWLIKNK